MFFTVDRGSEAALSGALKIKPWLREWVVALQKFIIERDIPKVGTFDREQLRQAAAKSNEVLRQVGPDIQWVESYVADNKTFCVYLAKDEAIIREKISIRPPPQPELLAVGMRRNSPNPGF